MKATDLMIGDYLQYNGMPYRVIQVTGLGGAFMLENGEEDCGEPIPLTPEILEKNGFTAQRPENHIEIVYCLQDISNAIADEMYALWPETYGFYLVIRRESKDMIRIGIKYVHELQHALRLCKIEKEIEL